MLGRHLEAFYEYKEASFISIVTPLLLALKSLISRSADMKNDLSANVAVKGVLVDAVSRSYGDMNFYLHLHIAGTILMCEVGYAQFHSVIADRIIEMQKQHDLAAEDKKVRLKERINRINEWAVDFKMNC